MSRVVFAALYDRNGAELRMNDTVVITVGTQFVHGRVVEIFKVTHGAEGELSATVTIEDKLHNLYTVYPYECARTRSEIKRSMTT